MDGLGDTDDQISRYFDEQRNMHLRPYRNCRRAWKNLSSTVDSMKHLRLAKIEKSRLSDFTSE